MFTVYREEFNKFTAIVPKSYHNGCNLPLVLIDPNQRMKYDMIIDERVDLGNDMKYIMHVQGYIECGYEYVIEDVFGHVEPMLLGYICRTKEFDKKYVYNGDDLGAVYHKTHTTFKVWTPTATDVRIAIYRNDKEILYDMVKDFDGIWTYTLNGDCEGLRYRYKVTNNEIAKYCIDPYAKASTADAEFSVVYNPNSTITVSKSAYVAPNSYTDCVIYEASIRDFTIKMPITNKYKRTRASYLGFIDVIPYLKRLGITHVQLMPVFDWEYEGTEMDEENMPYNWGYNPVQFMVPEGSYASSPNSPYSRVQELKILIQRLHDAGIGVIMDTVLNHVYDRNTHPFDALVPTYYYRYNHVGVPTNGSGCGNDLATERSMCRKYVLDTIKYWIEEYSIDGFRFDLMGLMDCSTANEISKMCKRIQPNTILYGEGWNMDTALPHQEKANKDNMCKIPAFGHFNDTFRDYIKGSSFNLYDRGLALGRSFNSGRHRHLMAGSCGGAHGETFMFNSPEQTINFVSCHDGNTLWDKICVALADKPEEYKRRVQMLCLSMVILSQGVPFLHGGCEFYRSKKGVENSYNKSDDINAIDWNQIFKNEESIDYVASLIDLRRSHGAFRFKTAYEIKDHLDIYKHYESIIEYRLSNVGEYGEYKDIIVYFNVHANDIELQLPSNIKGFRKLNGDNVRDSIMIPGLSTVVIVKE